MLTAGGNEMVKISHKTLKSKIAEQNWTQFALAEELDISDRQIRNLQKGHRYKTFSLLQNESGIRYHDGGIAGNPGG